MLIAARVTEQNGARQQAFSPERHQPWRIEMSRMNRPQPHGLGPVNTIEHKVASIYRTSPLIVGVCMVDRPDWAESASQGEPGVRIPLLHPVQPFVSVRSQAGQISSEVGELR